MTSFVTTRDAMRGETGVLRWNFSPFIQSLHTLRSSIYWHPLPFPSLLLLLVLFIAQKGSFLSSILASAFPSFFHHIHQNIHKLLLFLHSDAHSLPSLTTQGGSECHKFSPCRVCPWRRTRQAQGGRSPQANSPFGNAIRRQLSRRNDQARRFANALRALW